MLARGPCGTSLTGWGGACGVGEVRLDHPAGVVAWGFYGISEEVLVTLSAYFIIMTAILTHSGHSPSRADGASMAAQTLLPTRLVFFPSFLLFHFSSIHPYSLPISVASCGSSLATLVCLMPLFGRYRLLAPASVRLESIVNSALKLVLILLCLTFKLLLTFFTVLRLLIGLAANHTGMSSILEALYNRLTGPTLSPATPTDVSEDDSFHTPASRPTNKDSTASRRVSQVVFANPDHAASGLEKLTADELKAIILAHHEIQRRQAAEMRPEPVGVIGRQRQISLDTNPSGAADMSNSSIDLSFGPQSIPFSLLRRRTQSAGAEAATVNVKDFRNSSMPNAVYHSAMFASDTKDDIIDQPLPFSSWRMEQLKNAKPGRLVGNHSIRRIPPFHGPLSLPYARNPR